MSKSDTVSPAVAVASSPPARRGRPPKIKAQAIGGDTRELILDAAEDLFSKHGFYGVTVREVAREAGVDTALVHYYFGAKRDLFDAVFLRPPFQWSLKGGPGWKHYSALVAQTNANPAFGGETMARYFDPAVRRLIELVRQVLPGAREVDLYWAYHNLSGALTLTLGETGRLDRLSGGLCRSGDLETASEYMVRFAAAGFRAVCGPKQAD